LRLGGVDHGRRGRLPMNANEVILVIMRRMPLAAAKSHFSELVDQAEHQGKRVIILRHGKPAAAIVPVHVAVPPVSRSKPMSEREVKRSVKRFVAEFSATEPGASAVQDLIDGRR
jgi:prevent-host-death family protein